MDSAQAAAERYRRCYIPAERMYDAEVDPRSHADVIVDNRDTAAPVLRQGAASLIGQTLPDATRH
jgi:uridine kinase